MVRYVGTTVDKVYDVINSGECPEVDGVWVDVLDDSGQEITLVNIFSPTAYTEFEVEE